MDPVDKMAEPTVEDKLETLADATQALMLRTERPRWQTPPPTFDGTGDLEEFRARFHHIADLNGWRQDELSIRFKNVLIGTAKNGLNGCRGMDELFARLCTRYQLTERGRVNC